MEYTGRIVRIGQTQQVSEKFSKREFVVTDGAASYPQNIQFELHQDRCDLIDKFKEGDEVNIKFNLKGRDWQNPQGQIKTFNTLQAWAVVKVEGDKFKGESLVPTPDEPSDLPF